MPDLNFRNEQVTTEIKRISAQWLVETGLDGFRLDAIRHLIEDGSQMSDTDATHQWLAGYQQFLKSQKPSAMTIGEIWTDSMDVAPYVNQGEVDLAFEFSQADAILASINSNRPDALVSQLQRQQQLYHSPDFGSFLTNHDQNRLFNQLGKDLAKNQLAAGLLLTLPGVPFLYYGEEIGLTGEKPDPEIRTPLPWNGTLHGGFTQGIPWKSLVPGYEEKNIELQQKDEESLLSRYRQLIHLRNRHGALRRGDLSLLSANQGAILAFAREWTAAQSTQTLVIVANFSYRELSDVDVTLPAHSAKSWTRLEGTTPANLEAPSGTLRIPQLASRQLMVFRPSSLPVVE
jgi:glycosidase